MAVRPNLSPDAANAGFIRWFPLFFAPPIPVIFAILHLKIRVQNWYF